MKEAAHLIRLAALFAAGFVVFLLVRQAVVPPGFGQYGHYRSGALAENRAREIAFAGRTACVSCHDDPLQKLKSGKHKGVACEACHGPQAKHAADFANVKPTLPEARTLCSRCHAGDAAKPKWFPQVVVKDHFGGDPCNTCHQPHQPKV